MLADSARAMALSAGVRWRQGWASGGSLAAHGALVLAILAVSYLRLEPLAGPDRLVIFTGGGGPGPAAARAGAAAPPRPAATVRPAVTTRRPIVTRPRESQPIPETSASAPASPEPDDARRGVVGGTSDGSDDGPVGGEGDGILGDGFGPGTGGPGTPGLGGLGTVPSSPLAALPAPDQPIYIIGDVRPPERTTFVKPVYPELPRKTRTEGTVILEVVVGRVGDVESVKVVRSDPLFDPAAVEAVRQWKYRPALQGGRPVRVLLTVKVDFRLR